MDLSIIIVNWNSIDFTRDCVASIAATTHGLKYEVIVVDNASQDDCSCLADAPCAVQLIRSSSNLGFAGANNLGSLNAAGDKLLFLNPDTIVMEDAIRKMSMELDSASVVGAAGCRLLNRDLTVQTSSVQPFPTIWNQLFGLDWIQRHWPRWSLLGIESLASSDTEHSSDVEVVSGACIMVTRELFTAVGGFSTDYFMYAEEADLCYRIHQSGWKVRHVPDARIVHFGGEASKSQRSIFSDVVLRESVFKLLRKFRGSAYAYSYRAVLLLSALMRITILFPLLICPDSILEHAAVLRAFRKWRSVARWALAMEGWSQELATHSTSPSTTLTNS